MAKLSGLVRTVDPASRFLDDQDPSCARTGDGAVWTLVPDASIRAASRALARLLLVTAPDRHLVVDMGDELARRVADIASCMATPPTVWTVRGASIEPVVPVTAAPLSAVVDDWGPGARATPSRVDRAGLADPVAVVIDQVTSQGSPVEVERDGDAIVLTVLGLEIGRIVDEERGLVLELGVGRFERECRLELEGVRLVEAGLVSGHVAAIEAVAAEVVQRRRADASPHPARTLRRERWLRGLVVADPTLAGLDPGVSLEPLQAIRAPSALDEWSIAAARSAADVRGEGAAVVVCSVGPDPALPAEAAEVWLACAAASGPAGAGPLVVVVPRRDLLAPIARLLEGLRPELAVRVVPIADNWTNWTN
jgi:hypothetical protein